MNEALGVSASAGDRGCSPLLPTTLHGAWRCISLLQNPRLRIGWRCSLSSEICRQTY